MAMNESALQVELVHLGGVQQSTALLPAEHARSENNTGGVSPGGVQQPTAVTSAEHTVVVVDEEVRISEHNRGCLVFLASFALGPNQSDPFWRLILLTAVNLVTAAMIGLVCLPKALHQEVHGTYFHRVMLTMTVGAPIAVAMVTFLATIWIRRNDGQGRNNWITALSVANVSMLAGPLVLYWVLTTYYTGN